MNAGTARDIRPRPPGNSSAEERSRLTSLTGTVALGLDALASVAYGPEAIVVVLAAAGSAGIGATLPVTGVIVGLLLVLVACYRQVIAAYPDGGGAYTVARENLGARAGLVAAASLIVDYVLNIAVSIAAGIAALTSAFPRLLPDTTLLCVGALVLVTAVNLRGVLTSAKLFILPTLVFVLAIAVVVVVGLVRGAPIHPLPPTTQARTVGAVGIGLLLAAFANGCSALTGVEAIANATPSFRSDSRVRARRSEALLGGTLGLLLLGLATLIVRFDARPVAGRTLLSLVTEGAIGSGWGYVLVQLVTVVLLALAANTSFGGLPVLTARLARDHFLPHIFAIRADRLVHRYGILVLAGLAGSLLVVTRGNVNLLVSVFAVGVFIGFSLAQVGMVSHWRSERSRGWRPRAALNAVGAVLTSAAAVVLAAEKFTKGAWLVVVVVPLLTVTFTGIHRTYARIGRQLAIDPAEYAADRAVGAAAGAAPLVAGMAAVRSAPLVPAPVPSDGGPGVRVPGTQDLVVVVPVVSISRLTAAMVEFAESLSGRVVAVHVAFADETGGADRLRRDWERWRPGVPLTVLTPDTRDLGRPLAEFVAAQPGRVLVVLGEMRPANWWEGILKNGRAAALTRYLSHHGDAAVCRLRIPLGGKSVPPPSRSRGCRGEPVTGAGAGGCPHPWCTPG